MELEGWLTRHLYLTGFMGTGKTTIGARLARRLQRPFLDLDAQICARAGRSVVEIFSDLGERGFRAMEREVFFALSPPQPSIIALGGGALTQPGIREALPSRGLWISLRARLETIQARLSEDASRPLLKDPQGLRRLYERRALLERAAVCSIQVDDKTPEVIVHEIIEALCRRR